MPEQTKLNRADLVAKVVSIVRSETNDPAAELVRLGIALQRVGEALQGVTAAEARAVLEAVAKLV